MQTADDSLSYMTHATLQVQEQLSQLLQAQNAYN